MRSFMTLCAVLALSITGCDEDQPELAPEGYQKPIVTQSWPRTELEEREGPLEVRGGEQRAAQIATAHLRGQPSVSVEGEIRLSEEQGRVTVEGRIDGLSAGAYELRVHDSAACDLSNPGPIFSPRVGGDDAMAAGDLGTVQLTTGGAFNHPLSTGTIALTGGAHAVAGKVLVLARPDGEPVACGPIRPQPAP
jgi:hypothetical protein